MGNLGWLGITAPSRREEGRGKAVSRGSLLGASPQRGEGSPRLLPGPAGRWLLLVALLAGGCSQAPVRDPEFASVRPPLPTASPPTVGAIYRVNYGLILFEDLRARRVGDILTIKLVERMEASKTAETDLQKSSLTEIPNPTLFGSYPQFDLPHELPLASTENNTLDFHLESNHDFEGGGESSQSNRLSGDISVTVAEVLPNGDLVVQGEKLLTLNQGHEHVRISGTVRTADIGPDNVVLSTRVTNARIIYAGQGAIADANALGWLSRVLLSPFFPF